ncbi:MAG: hypothetical protein HC812_18040 [Leptolyngbya sp. RL_3_1]|nr:hypothetical protein [Leptolyngbya sp. RL_3_1]
MKLTLAYSDGFTELLLRFEVTITGSTAVIAYSWFAPHHPKPYGEFTQPVDRAKWDQIEQKLRALEPYYGVTMDDLHSVTISVQGSAVPDYQRCFYGLGPNLYDAHPELWGPLIEISQFVAFCKARCHKAAVASMPKRR